MISESARPHMLLQDSPPFSNDTARTSACAMKIHQTGCYAGGSSMERYVILTNRKRAIVALVHTVVFLAVAMYGMLIVVRPLAANSLRSAWIMTAVYAVVMSILLALAAFSGNGIERIYFAFCTTSAAFGLARQIVGDPRMYVAVYIRVAMLACAVAAGIVILRRHGRAGWVTLQPGGITVSESQDG